MKIRQSGFTLVELMVTVVIAAILLSIAIPSYSNYVRKGRRVDAKSALLDMASLEERYYSNNNAYSTTTTDLGYAAGTWPVTVGAGTGTYLIAAPVVVAATAPTAGLQGGVPASFTITATATGDQANDTQCLTFTVTSQGVQSSTPATSATCWR
jgi:type IV pilus assembly protein PilE